MGAVHRLPLPAVYWTRTWPACPALAIRQQSTTAQIGDRADQSINLCSHPTLLFHSQNNAVNRAATDRVWSTWFPHVTGIHSRSGHLLEHFHSHSNAVNRAAAGIKGSTWSSHVTGKKGARRTLRAFLETIERLAPSCGSELHGGSGPNKSPKDRQNLEPPCPRQWWSAISGTCGQTANISVGLDAVVACLSGDSPPEQRCSPEARAVLRLPA